MILPAVTPLATPYPCVNNSYINTCGINNRFQIWSGIIVRDKHGNYYFEAWTDGNRKILIPVMLEDANKHVGKKSQEAL